MAIKGFKAAAVAANLRYKDRPDLGLIVSDGPAAWAGVFTQSVCQAAPVIWSRPLANKGRGRAILANSGQANAQTGREGDANCLRSAELIGAALGCPPEEIMLASTGIIGQQVNMPALAEAVPGLAAALSPGGLDDFARAIMTTDTFAKTAASECACDGGTVSVWGCAKGSGMIAPNMATMLGFVLTDANIAPELLRGIIREGADMSFNRVTVDGDTSTNDCLMLMASGAALVTGGPALEAFKTAVFTVMRNLARQIAKDGEGATKLVTVRLRGAASPEEALLAARTVAESPLVKTAFFGGDANWGRVFMALGRSGARFDPYAVNMDLDDVPWVRNGIDNGREEAASAVMQKTEYVLDINLNAGTSGCEMLTCDFSHEYVSINGDYRS
ncbi:MAG: bifunctional glutamate N-acetyltransferase/amino-acid acetyltransferase ArgJ [Candidatus Adiutrix sp.]|jgi:glutamate N-acetyltransferase/amino-acid N-acetyltransferase|nr:bifunctional glutamate N-acetyltransferase/amino-acid acetyltransferase ArgJ [Candidatus Adiutrix sp.]